MVIRKKAVSKGWCKESSLAHHYDDEDMIINQINNESKPNCLHIDISNIFCAHSGSCYHVADLHLCFWHTCMLKQVFS